MGEQSTECAGKEWDTEKYPSQAIFKVVIPEQGRFDYERMSFWEDHLGVNPWSGLVSLQLLESSNRSRRVGTFPWPSWNF